MDFSNALAFLSRSSISSNCLSVIERDRASYSRWFYQTKPMVAFVLSLIGGVFILLGGGMMSMFAPFGFGEMMNATRGMEATHITADR